MEEHTEVILKQTITEHVQVDPEIRDEVASFTKDMFSFARNTMRFGMANEKMALAKIFFGAAVRSVGKDFQTTENEGRVALDNLFASMREIPKSNAAPVATLAPRVDDSDEGPHDGEVPH